MQNMGEGFAIPFDNTALFQNDDILAPVHVNRVAFSDCFKLTY